MFMETKRCVLYIIRIQTGSNLMEVMIRPVTAEDEDRWDALVREELSTANDPHKRNAYTEASHTLVDITSLTYPEIKSIALRNLIALEERGRLTRENNFQDLLNEIAVDIRNKHRRRVQRQHELETVKQTITHLEAKQCYLQEKLDAYNNTYEQSLTTLQSKSARRQGAGALGKKMLNPFGKQATHLRELARRGEEPRFGSYKYSAAVLQSKGILLSWEGRNLREDDVTVSSDAINEFVIEGSRGQIVIPGAVSRFTWDELLEAEYEGRETIEFFGGNGGAEDVEGYHGGGGSMNGGAGVGRKSIDVRRGKSVDMGPRRGVLRVDRKAFGELLSKKFWREAS
jgi:Ras GTPase-activating-like protein IQGAP2/3